MDANTATRLARRLSGVAPQSQSVATAYNFTKGSYSVIVRNRLEWVVIGSESDVELYLLIHQGEHNDAPR